MSQRPGELRVTMLALGLGLLVLAGGVMVFFLTQRSAIEKLAPLMDDGTAGAPPAVARPPRVRPKAKVVLRSTLAGTWYSADPDALSVELAGYHEKAAVEPREDVVALVLPHAGYAYSGQTAAYGLKSLGQRYARVVVIGPSHRLPMEDIFSVPRVTHYETPLGEVPLDVDFIERLLTYSMFQNVPAAHQTEHSVQIEVPLLQYKLGDFRLVPIVAGQCSPETVARAGQALASLIDPNTLVVASSDFTHYGPRFQYVPSANGAPKEVIEKIDMGAYAFIEALDADGLLAYRRKTGATICGCVPVAVLLSMLADDVEVELLKYTTSGELMGDWTNSVSYLSAAFYGMWKAVEAPATGGRTQRLTEQDKHALLSLARQTIRYGLDHQKMPQLSDVKVTLGEAMRIPRAAFVTLKRHGQLRGCIGDIFPQRPLYKSVLANAIYAAFADRRFGPLSEAEYDEITIEISALTAPSPVSSPHDIRIGTDGMVLRKAGKSAVFLPQVAPEQGWDLATTLEHLSAKAGLERDAWKDGASFEVFQAEVFGEEE